MQSKFKRLRHLVLNIFRVGQDIYCVYSQCMALDSFHAQIQISNSKCDMGHFPIFNKTWLSWTGEADICCYNSVPNTVPGWLVTSFNRAKCWKKQVYWILPFSYLNYNKNLLVHRFICVWLIKVWFEPDADIRSFASFALAREQPHGATVVLTNQSENVLEFLLSVYLLPGSCLFHELLERSKMPR